MNESGSESGGLILAFENSRELEEAALLFLAMGVPFHIGEEFTLFIPPERADRAREQLSAYLAENRGWPAKEPPTPDSPFRFTLSHLAVLCALSFFHWKTSGFSASVDWKTKGRFSAAEILSGEWQQTVTALTLHADSAHLLGNFSGLLLFGGAVAHTLGAGAAWLFILVSGALGNGLNALFYQTEHYSLGASTGVFSALGILAGLGAIRRLSIGKPWVPLAAALGLLGILGVSPDGRIDVTAHIFGFIAGVPTGLAASIFARPGFAGNPVWQAVNFVVFGAVVYWCWRLALLS